MKFIKFPMSNGIICINIDKIEFILKNKDNTTRIYHSQDKYSDVIENIESVIKKLEEV